MTRRRRVLACAFTCCPPGKPGFTGGEDLLGWNLLVQISRSHEVWVLTNSEDRASVEEGALELGLENVHFEYVGLPRWAGFFLKFQGTHQLYYYFWQLKAWLVARRLQKQVDFELFHHITYANDWMTNFIGALLPVPYIRGPGGGAHRTPKGFGSEYTFGGRIWEKVRSLSQWVFRHEPLFLRGQGRAKALLVCNKEAASGVAEKWSGKVEMFPVSGISEEDLRPAKLVNGAGKLRVVTAGSLIRVKGFGLAIKAFQKFAEKYPESELAIVGSGPEESRLRALAKGSGSQANITFLGELGREQVLSEMTESDVFLFPSLRDGGGTVVIEAMGVGRPVVCLDTGGPGLHIDDECGVKITPESPQQAVDAMADALERLCQDPDLRLRLGQAARRKAEKYYSWDNLGDRLMRIYDQGMQPEEVSSPR